MSNLFAGVVPVTINREMSMATILDQLVELDDIQLAMVMEYVHGLKAADIFLRR